MLDGADNVGLLAPGAVPEAVAVLSTLPASTSVCVMVCVPVQVVDTPGAKVEAAQVAAASSCVSEIATPLNVTLPLLVTVNAYGIVEPAVAPVGPNRTR